MQFVLGAEVDEALAIENIYADLLYDPGWR